MISILLEIISLILTSKMMDKVENNSNSVKLCLINAFMSSQINLLLISSAKVSF